MTRPIPQPTDPAPPVTVEDTLGISAEDWAGMYLSAQKRFEDVCMSVLAKVAEGGSLAAVIDLVGDWMDGCDCIDDESLALFERAKAAAPTPSPQPLFRARVHDTGGGWVTLNVHPDTTGYPERGTAVVVVEDSDA